MKILKNLVIKDLKLNKKRTIGTIVGIVLSCALIMVVMGMFITLYNSILQSQINSTGYYHLKIYDLNQEDIEEIKNNDRVKEIYTVNNIGYVNYDEDFEYTMTGFVYSIDEKVFTTLKYKIEEGKFPKNENELLINQSFKYQREVEVGDEVSLKIFDQQGNETIKDFKITGVINRYDELVTTNIDGSYVGYIVLKNPNNYKKDISNILGVSNYRYDLNLKYDNFDINLNILRWEVFDFSDDAFRIIGSVIIIAIVIIMVTSIFSIRNSFAISISEKIKTYGMLSSIGATKRQIRKMVIYEGLVIGLVGISIGVVFGLLVNLLLVWLINFLANNVGLFGDNFGLYYKFSFIPIVISIIVSFIIIYLSVFMSAIKASHVSPIQNIRNSDNIKAKKLRIPKVIGKVFGIGGVLSYKNLKRSKRKYRVTVISLTVSILVFITTSSLVGYVTRTIKDEYGELDYNLVVYGSLQDEELSDEINRIMALPGAITKESVYSDYGELRDESKVLFEHDDDFGVVVTIELYNDEYFKEYVKKINGNYDYLKDKVIVLNRARVWENGNSTYVKLTSYKKGDTLDLYNFNSDDKVTYHIGDVVEKLPTGIVDISDSSITLVGNSKYFTNRDKLIGSSLEIFFDSDNPYELEKDIKDISDKIYVDNYYDAVSKLRTIVLILSIVIYGFIIVVTMIGVTSVFNTINSNMELRSKDFATLKSIGMTKKEFNNMINLEAIFYSFKSLMYGIILGILGSYGVYNIFLEKYHFSYVLPIDSIIISIIFIVFIVLIIMRYSIKKINKQNIIETIRNSNI